MTYWAQACQDQFVANLLNFKREGYYLDIGAGSPDSQNNTYFFDSELDWEGVCVEITDYTEDYKKLRSCRFINSDATKIDYKIIFDELKYPKRIDFLSVDIDEGSAEALKQIPFEDYRFSIIIIEHDLYRIGSYLRDEEREILKKQNYHLLFGDVLVPLSCGALPWQPFEDWWVDLSVFNVDKLNNLVTKVGSDKLYSDHIINVLKTLPDVISNAYTANNHLRPGL